MAHYHAGASCAGPNSSQHTTSSLSALRCIRLRALCGAALGALLAVSAAAQDMSSSGALEEIIVTAQRREENLQRTALAVAVVNADLLSKAGITDVTSLTNVVPSLIVQPSTGTSIGFYLRGVGSLVGNAFTENPVAFNFNQIYVARPAGLLGTFYDLERVEVLKGPQGTLYGRNATGGAINVIPKRPTLGETSGTIEVEGGNYDLWRGQAAINLDMGGTAALRVAGRVSSRDGYLSDGYDDEEGQALRGSLLFEPSDTVSAVIVADYFHQGGKGPGSVIVPSAITPGAPDPSRRIGSADPIASAAFYAAILASQLPPPAKADGALPGIIRPRQDGFVDTDVWGISADIDIDLGGATLTVIPGYRDSRPDYLTYSGGYYGRVIETSKQKSLEVRLSSGDDGPLRYVLGGYFFDEDQNTFNHFLQGAVLSTKFVVDMNNRSKALFGQATYAFSEEFRAVAGVRYSHERKKQNTGLTQTGIFAGVPVDPFNNTVPAIPTSGSKSFEKVNWKAGVEWDAGPSNLIYANVATGFKSGGFFIAVLDNTFDPENITAYTVGSKNRFMDNRVQFNVEGFYWDYKDQQINYIGPTRNLNAQGQQVVGAGLVTTNAGASRIYGTEVELSFQASPLDLLTVDVQYLNGKYNDFKYLAASANPAPPRTSCPVTATVVPGFQLPPPGTTFIVDCSNRPQINTPKWSANLSYEHTFDIGADMELLLGARTKIESARYLSPEYLPEERQGGYMTSDAYLTLNGAQQWSVTAYINNIEDETIFMGTSLRPVYPSVFNFLRAPRTYGLRASYTF